MRRGLGMVGGRLGASRGVWRWVRTPRNLVGVGVLLAALTPVPSAWAYGASAGRTATVADAPSRPVAIVFGAGLTRAGEPTPFLAARLDIAADLYRRDKVRAVLVTGDHGRDEYNEPDAMRTYLTTHGLPERKVVADYAGFDTWDSCVRARKIFGVTGATVISQSFHLPRAVALCRAAGLDAAGVGDDTWEEWPGDTAWGYVREVPATGKALVTALTRPDPRFLGPHEPGVTRALTP